MATGVETHITLAQAVPLPDFSGLPPYAQGILYTVLAIGLALSFLVPRMGFLHGRDTAKAAGGTGGTPLVVAAVADPTALNNVSVAIVGLTNQLAASQAVSAKLAENVDELRQELRFINSRPRNNG